MNLLQTQVQPRELRPYQAEAIELLRQSLRSGHRRPILQAPTGWGKTRLASEIVMMARERGNRIVFCVPALSLIDQTLESFWKEGIGDVGVIQANHFETDWSRPVQVASVQTLQRRPLPDAQLVIVDECHKLFKHYTTWMQHPEWTKVPFIGLSATPWTKGLGKHYDDLIISATTADLIEAGFLAKFRVFAPAHPDLTGVRVQAGDYVEGDLAKAMDKAPLIADVVETWLRKGEGRPTLCFGVDRAHAKHLQERFESVGVQCGYQDMATEPDERAEIKRKFHNGEYAVVSNVGTLTTGVDWDVRCIILARPTRSEILYVQIIGRGLRTADGKDDCLILDHSDSTLKLGFVTDIIHESLDMGTERQKQEKKKPLPKECPSCSYLMPPGTPVCPACGFQRKVVSNIAVEDGELVELTRNGGSKRVNSREIEIRGRKIPLSQFYGELKDYARTHGYRDGWASNKYREAAGTWPNAYRDTPMVPVSFDVESWVKARARAWAKKQPQRGGNHGSNPTP